MFRNQSSGGASSGGHLVEFRAGRMTYDETTKIVTPDKRKGLVYLTHNDDGLVHFCWKDRTTNKVEDDLIIFPDDFEFKHIDQCKTGRVYMLKFKNSKDRKFFWLQEPKTDKDEEYCRRVNEVMNKPPEQRSTGGGDNNDLHYMLNNMSQQQLMQLFGGVGQISGLSSLLGAVNNRSGQGAAERLTLGNRSAQNASSNAADNNTSATTTESSKENNGKKSKNGVPIIDGGSVDGISIDLAPVLANSEAVDSIISDPTRSALLAVHLPAIDDQERKQAIKEHITSPQFQQALQNFTSALQSAQLGPLLTQFQLPAEAVSSAYSGDIEDFIRALESALPAGVSMSSTSSSATPSAVKDVAVVKPESSSQVDEQKKADDKK